MFAKKEEQKKGRTRPGCNHVCMLWQSELHHDGSPPDFSYHHLLVNRCILCWSLRGRQDLGAGQNVGVERVVALLSQLS